MVVRVDADDLLGSIELHPGNAREDPPHPHDGDAHGVTVAALHGARHPDLQHVQHDGGAAVRISAVLNAHRVLEGALEPHTAPFAAYFQIKIQQSHADFSLRRLLTVRVTATCVSAAQKRHQGTK